MLRKELYVSKEYKDNQIQKRLDEQENKRKKYREDIKNGKIEKDIEIIMSHLPNGISRTKIIEILIETT